MNKIIDIKPTPIPTEQDIERIKNEIEKKNQLLTYQNLNTQLEEITESINAPKEQDGYLKSEDTHKLLKTKRTKETVAEIIFNRLIAMLSPRPVINTIIALALMLTVLILLRSNTITHIGTMDITSYAPYIGYFALAGGAYQIIKSGSRSLFVVLIATLIGGLISYNLAEGAILFTFDANIYAGLFLAGLLGTVIAIFNMS